VEKVEELQEVANAHREVEQMAIKEAKADKKEHHVAVKKEIKAEEKDHHAAEKVEAKAHREVEQKEMLKVEFQAKEDHLQEKTTGHLAENTTQENAQMEENATSGIRRYVPFGDKERAVTITAYFGIWRKPIKHEKEPIQFRRKQRKKKLRPKQKQKQKQRPELHIFSIRLRQMSSR
jgi:hypothetical protein